jgi:hypothetical protein
MGVSQTATPQPSAASMRWPKITTVLSMFAAGSLLSRLALTPPAGRVKRLTVCVYLASSGSAVVLKNSAETDARKTRLEAGAVILGKCNRHLSSFSRRACSRWASSPL